MALDEKVRPSLANAIGSDYIAKNIYDTVNAAAGGAAAAGASGAIQKSDGAAGFADSGIVASAGSITTGAWNATAIAVAKGGTGSTTAAAARTALGLGTAAVAATTDFQAASAKLATIVSTAPVSITGSQVGGQALASVIAALVSLGLGTDNTTT